MFSDSVIYLAAKMLIERSGNLASAETSWLAEDFLDSGDIEGAAICLRIRDAVRETLRDRPDPGETIH